MTVVLQCHCAPVPVDLYTAAMGPGYRWSQAVFVSRLHRQGRTGLVCTCRRCGRAWAVAGSLAGVGPVRLVHVPRLEPERAGARELDALVVLAAGRAREEAQA